MICMSGVLSTEVWLHNRQKAISVSYAAVGRGWKGGRDLEGEVEWQEAGGEAGRGQREEALEAERPRTVRERRKERQSARSGIAPYPGPC